MHRWENVLIIIGSRVYPLVKVGHLEEMLKLAVLEYGLSWACPAHDFLHVEEIIQSVGVYYMNA